MNSRCVIALAFSITLTLCSGNSLLAEPLKSKSKSKPKATILPPGSFLRRSAPDLKRFQKELATDPLLVKRYARTFQMAPKLVQAAFRGAKIAPMPEDRALQVYFVRPGEEIGYKTRRVKKGTPVVTLSDGTPALLNICGNPIRNMQKALTPTPETKLAKQYPEFDPQEEIRPPAPPALNLKMRSATPDAPVEIVQEAGASDPRVAFAAEETPLEENGIPLEQARPTLSKRNASWLSLGSGFGSGLYSLIALSGLFDNTRSVPAGRRSDFTRDPDALGPNDPLPPPPGSSPGQHPQEGENQVRDWVNNPAPSNPPANGGGGGAGGGGVLPLPGSAPNLPNPGALPPISGPNATALLPEPGVAALLVAAAMSGVLLGGRRYAHRKRQTTGRRER